MPPIIPNKSQSTSNSSTTTSTQNTTNTQQSTETVNFDSTSGKTPSQINREDSANSASQSGTAQNNTHTSNNAPTTASEVEALIREQIAQSDATGSKIIATNDGDGVNVRVGTETNTEILTALPDGASVEVIDSGKDGWLHIRTEDGIEGYIKSDYLIDSNSNTNNTGEPSSVHTVQPGDTMWDIAERELGDGSRYQEIADYNNIENPSLIQPGQEIKIPPQETTQTSGKTPSQINREDNVIYNQSSTQSNVYSASVGNTMQQERM